MVRANGLSTVFFILGFIAAHTEAGQHEVQRESISRRGMTIVLRIVDETGSLIDSQVSVRLLSDGISLPLVGNTQAGRAIFADVSAGNYEAQVTAMGYQLGKLDFVVPDKQTGVFETDVHLSRVSVESSALALDTSALVPKARKDMKRGLQALKAGKLKESTQQLQAAYKMAPADPDVNFLMGSLFNALKDSEQAKGYFLKASWVDPRHVPSLVALGQLLTEQGNLTQATSFFQRAISLDRKQWLAHLLLADIYFGRHDYVATRQEAEQAVRWGKDAAISGELLAGLSCIKLGRIEEALPPLERFLQGSPNRLVLSEVQKLVVQSRQDLARGSRDSMMQVDSMEHDLARLVSIPTPELSLPSWVPPSLDDEKPILDTATVCPLDQILDGTNRSVDEFFTSIGSFTASETLTHQHLDNAGQPTSEENRKYDYLAFTRAGGFSFDEYRNGTLDLEQFPARIATLGLSGLEVVFHSKLRDNYRFTCEGLTEIGVKPAWVVYFQQRDDRPSLLQSFQVDGISRSVDVKGRAWITTDRFQIVQIETDLVKPVPAVHLLAEREFVEYQPIHFHTPAVELWLPSNVEIYLEFRGKRYRRIDTYSDYKMFSVETREVIEPPKVARTH